MKWVSVHDLLPEDRVDVLIFIVGCLRDKSNVRLGYLNKEKGWFGVEQDEKVSHWAAYESPKKQKGSE